MRWRNRRYQRKAALFRAFSRFRHRVKRPSSSSRLQTAGLGVEDSDLIWPSNRLDGSRLDCCERFSHRFSEVWMVIKIVVPRIDCARKDQVADRLAERRATPRRYDLVVVRHDHGRRRERTTSELERGHAVAEEQADGSPPVKLPRQGLQRVERRNQDQPRNGSMPGQIGRDGRAEAEADR